MGCVIAGLVAGGFVLIFLFVGFAFLGSGSEHVVASYIGIGFLIGAFLAGIGMAVAFNE